MIQDVGAFSGWSLNPFIANFLLLWHALRMKLGFGPVTVVLAISATVQGDCPDYTTYSQVSANPRRERLATNP
jgi:hypothetical protein